MTTGVRHRPLGPGRLPRVLWVAHVAARGSAPRHISYGILVMAY